MNDRLYRSRTDRVISGVAGGLAERMDVDPSIVRVVWVVLAFASGGLLALVYLVMMVVVPEAPFDSPGRFGGPDPWSSPAATGIRPDGSTGGGADAAPVAASGDVGAPAAEPGGTTSTDPALAGATDETSTYAVADAPTPPSAAGTWLAPDGRRVERVDPGFEPPRAAAQRDRSGGGGLVVGVILILVGAWFLIREYLPEVDLDATWPVLAVVAGVVLVVLALVPDRSRS